MWDKLNKSWTLTIATVVVIGLVYGVWTFTHRVPAQAGSAIAGLPAAIEGPSIPHGSAELPQPDEHTTGKIHIKVQPKPVIVQNATGKPDTVIPPPITIDLYPQDNGAPRIDQKDTSSILLVVYQEVREPYVRLGLELMAGVSANPDFKFSPAGLISFVRLFSRVRCGVMGDRFGLGPSLAVELLPQLSLSGRWNLLSIDPGGKWVGAILYRFPN